MARSFVVGRPIPISRYAARGASWLCALTALASFSCQEGTDAIPDFPATTPHEKYEYAFRQIGLQNTALGYRWIAASYSALEQALPIEPPYRETGYFDPNSAESLGFLVQMRRGQRLLVELEVAGQVFIDLFRVREDSLAPYQPVQAAEAGETDLDFFVRRSGSYVLRLQPEMLAGGRYEITVTNASSLTFPVSGHGMDAIRSGFGDSRDGGRREHHGVDIFASRGTPVVAGAQGTVRSTRGSRLGGKVVWLRTDPQGNLYYAHLDSVAVRRGMRVQAGDTLGFVGNTGNARTTPPHLHFGVYSGGPIDPAPYLFSPPSDPPRLLADVELVGKEVRASLGAVVRTAASRRSEALVETAKHTPMRVLGGAGDYYRVLLPDSVMGFIPASSVEPFATPVASEVLATGGVLLDRPTESGEVMDSVGPGKEIPVLGHFGSYALVRTETGRLGWLLKSGLGSTAVVADGGGSQP